jgi:diguanylate cyclase (GGDEF)-like protein
MSPANPARDGVLLALERKRVLDFVWILTLAFQACVLLLFGWLGWIDRGVGAISRGVLVCGVLFVLAADLSYRLRTARTINASIHANQVIGVALLSYLWALSGGVEYPGGLAFFVPPLVVSGMVGLAWLPRLTAALALGGVWAVAYQQSGDTPWNITWLTADGGSGSRRAGVLLFFSFAAVGLAATSTALSRLLMRLYQRIRSQTDLSDEARGTFEAVMRGASEPAVVVYADTFQLIHASDSFYRRMLLDPEKVAGRSLYNLLQFENRQRMEILLQEPSGVIPFQQIRIGPEPIVVNLRFSHSQGEGSRYVSITFEEVTDLYYFQSAFDAVDDALLIVGDVGDLLYSNRTANELFGELYVGKPMLGVLRSHRLVARNGLPGVRNLERIEVSGIPFHLSVMAPKQSEHGQSSRVFWLRRFTEEEMRQDRASRDPLTGVRNRRTFERELQHELREVSANAPLALSLWSIDGWKDLSEELGDDASDAALKSFAQILGEELRGTDSLCRLDGEVFGVIHPGSDLRGAEAAVQRLLLALERHPVAMKDERRNLSVSVGVTVCRPQESVAALVARADEALYAAKDGGGGTCVLREPEPA